MPETRPHHETQEFLPADAEPGTEPTLEPVAGPQAETVTIEQRDASRARPRVVANVIAALRHAQADDFAPDEFPHERTHA